VLHFIELEHFNSPLKPFSSPFILKKFLSPKRAFLSKSEFGRESKASLQESMAVANTRIKKETERLLAEPVEGVSATPYEDNVRYFNVAIAGPMDSPFQGLYVYS
jgi:hypothetical protein